MLKLIRAHSFPLCKLFNIYYRFTSENIKKLLDYVTIMPETDDHNTGHKFPFNACEILQSDNSFILEKIFESVEQTERDEEKMRAFSVLSVIQIDSSIEEAEEETNQNYDYQEIDQHNPIPINPEHNDKEIENKNSCEKLEARDLQAEPNGNLNENSNLHRISEDCMNECEKIVKLNEKTNLKSENGISYPINEFDSNENDDQVINEIAKKFKNLEIQVNMGPIHGLGENDLNILVEKIDNQIELRNEEKIKDIKSNTIIQDEIKFESAESVFYDNYIIDMNQAATTVEDTKFKEILTVNNGNKEDKQNEVPCENKVNHEVLIDKTVLEAPIENSNHEVPIENSKHEIPIENSNHEEPIENSKHEEPIENSINKVPIENSNHEVLIDNTIQEVPIENSNHEVLIKNQDNQEIPNENSNHEVFIENYNQVLIIENQDNPEVLIHKNQDNYDILLENQYNQEYLIEENQDNHDILIENQDSHEIVIEENQVNHEVLIEENKVYQDALIENQINQDALIEENKDIQEIIIEKNQENHEVLFEENQDNQDILIENQDIHEVLIEDTNHEVLIENQDNHEILVEENQDNYEDLIEQIQENTEVFNKNHEGLVENNHNIENVDEEQYEILIENPQTEPIMYSEEGVEHQEVSNNYTTNQENNEKETDLIHVDERREEEKNSQPKQEEEEAEEERNPSTNVRHKTIPRHVKRHSQRHEFLTEDENIFNISNEDLNEGAHLQTPVKEVRNYSNNLENIKI